MPSLLVTGVSGLLGRRVAARAVAAGWRVVGTYHHRAEAPAGVEAVALDLVRGGAEALVADVRPDAVVHTAYTLDATMWRVVVDGSAAVARGCAAAGARLVHLSTDVVFGGRAAPYTEADPPEPVTPYGAAKAAAEAVVAALCPQATLVRTSLLYTAPGDEPVDSNRRLVAALASDPSRGALFTDEYRCPLCVDDLAEALLELLAREAPGPLHVAGPAALSRHEIGVLLARSAGLDAARLPGRSARGLCRPTRVVLDSSRAHTVLRTRLRAPAEVLGVAR